MCICKENNWCRDWSEQIKGGVKFSPSDHAPGCDEYKEECFIVVEYDGTKCVIDIKDGHSFVDKEYTATIIYITRDQFEALEEFQGF